MKSYIKDDDMDSKLEIQEFYNEIKKKFSDLKEEIDEMEIPNKWKKCIKEVAFFDEDIRSNKYKYKSEFNAKMDCITEIIEIVEETKEYLTEQVKEYVERTMNILWKMNALYKQFIIDLYEEYDLIAAKQSPYIQKYIMKKKNEIFLQEILRIQDKSGLREFIVCNESEKISKKFDIDKLISECEIDFNGKKYCYIMSDALADIDDWIEDYIAQVKEQLPNELNEFYKKIIYFAIDIWEKYIGCILFKNEEK